MISTLSIGCGGNQSVAGPAEEIAATPSKPANTKFRPPAKPLRPRVDDSIDPQAFDLFITAVALEELRDYPSAANLYKRALQYHPNSHEIRLSFARMLAYLRQYRNVLEVLEIIKPQDDPVQQLRAACWRELGGQDSAKHCYLLAVQDDSSNTTPYAFLVGYYQRRNDIDSCIWAYQNLVRLRGHDFSLWYELGKLHSRAGNYEDAQYALRESIRLRSDDGNMMAYVHLGEVYEALKMPDSAIFMFQSAQLLDTTNLVLNRILSRHYVMADSLSEALPYAKRVAAAAPMERNGVRRLAIIYYAVDSLDQADSLFNSLVEGGDQDRVNYSYMGRIASIRNDYERALDEFAKALPLADTASDAYLDLGYVYARLNRDGEEVELYKRGLQKVPDSAGTIELLLALGVAYERQKEINLSIETLENLIELAPDNATALNFLGYLLADRGERLDYAKQLIETAVAQEPNNAAFLDSYGWVFYRMEDYNSALTHLKRAAELIADPVIFDHLGDAYMANGETELARQWWHRALEQDPENMEIKQKLGD